MFATSPVTFSLTPSYPVAGIVILLVAIALLYWLLTHQPMVKAKMELLKQQARQVDEEIVQKAHLAKAQFDMFIAQTRAHNAVAANNEHLLAQAQAQASPAVEMAPPAVLVKAGEPGNPFPKVS